MSVRLESRDWDSQFFGVPIGSADLAAADQAQLAAIDAEARSLGIRCLYGELEPSNEPSSVVLQEHGWRLVEVATMFDLRQDEPPIPCPDGVTVRVGTTDDLEPLAGAIDALASWSRFAADPRFGVEAARRLQWAATKRAARDTTGQHELVVADLHDQPVAFITRCLQPSPRVDAVGTTARGSGAARYLIEDARAWAGDVALLGGPIAARNVHALRYVSRCGYRVCAVTYKYHRWLDD
jgi:hypothetical protein